MGPSIDHYWWAFFRAVTQSAAKLFLQSCFSSERNSSNKCSCLWYFIQPTWGQLAVHLPSFGTLCVSSAWWIVSSWMFFLSCRASECRFKHSICDQINKRIINPGRIRRSIQQHLLTNPLKNEEKAEFLVYLGSLLLYRTVEEDVPPFHKMSEVLKYFLDGDYRDNSRSVWNFKACGSPLVMSVSVSCGWEAWVHLTGALQNSFSFVAPEPPSRLLCLAKEQKIKNNKRFESDTSCSGELGQVEFGIHQELFSLASCGHVSKHFPVCKLCRLW